MAKLTYAQAIRKVIQEEMRRDETVFVMGEDVEKLGGVSPKRAPTYLAQQRGGERITGERFVCSVCGYEYKDPNFGFEELPADWSCPICKMPKKAFVRKK